MQQVEYTHLSGTKITYTSANTVSQLNYIIGNSTPSTSSTVIAQLTANASGTINHNGITYYYRTLQPVYSNDFGLWLWAQETLTPTEHTVFTGQSAIWSSNVTAREVAEFKYWWNRYCSDPNVKVTE